MLGLLSISLLGCGSSAGTGVEEQNPHAKVHEEMHNEYIEERSRKPEATDLASDEEGKEASIVPETPGAALLHAKWQNGVIFFALGNEPSWSLNINQNNHVIFTTDRKIFSSASISKLGSLDAKSIGYRSSNKQGELLIRLLENACADSTSGGSFSFNASVEVKLKGEKEFTAYQGCGDYVPDIRLHGKWMIVKVDTLSLKPDQFENKIPELSIDTYNRLVFGNDGCNSFRGQLKFRDNEISFGMLAGTLMACPNMDVSSLITGAFSDKKLKYSFKKDLFFYEGDKQVMRLQRADK